MLPRLLHQICGVGSLSYHIFTLSQELHVATLCYDCCFNTEGADIKSYVMITFQLLKVEQSIKVYKKCSIHLDYILGRSNFLHSICILDRYVTGLKLPCCVVTNTNTNNTIYEGRFLKNMMK